MHTSGDMSEQVLLFYVQLCTGVKVHSHKYLTMRFPGYAPALTTFLLRIMTRILVEATSKRFTLINFAIAVLVLHIRYFRKGVFIVLYVTDQ